ncbi:Mut7-C RNAse domain-containing protein [Aquifex pyrophilus]
MKFYLEENLEKLARWLRFLGYPAYTIKGEINLSKIKPDGVFITTSRRWYERLKKLGINAFLVPRHDFELQLCSVVKHFKLRHELSLNLCAYCSSPLVSVSREEVREKIPKRVYEEGEDFTLCPGCGAVFWKGSHYERMKRKLEEILKKC